jgi:CAAX protease family protein
MMIEIIFLLLISWLLIWLVQRENLSVLGLSISKMKMKYSVILFFVTAVCCLSGLLMRMYFGQEVFIINPGLSSSFIFTGLWATFKSVLFEELLTRGVLLYILIKRLGEKWAVFISSLFFGLLHLNNVTAESGTIEILLTIVYPFIFGLVMAYSYAKTFSIYFPFAIHFGWNIVENFIIPKNASTNTILLLQEQPIITVSYFVFFLMLLFPKIAAMISNYLIVKQIKI